MIVQRISNYDPEAPISIEECKQYLRREDTSQFDSQIRTARNAAVIAVEKRSRKIMAPADCLGYVGRWPCGPLRIPVEPVDVVTGITYKDSDNAEQTIPLSEFDVEYQAGRATIMFNGTFSSPSIYAYTSNPITVAFQAGYDWPHDGTGAGSDPAFAMDPRIRIVILMLTQHWFENRGVVRVGETVSPIDTTAEALLQGLDTFGT